MDQGRHHTVMCHADRPRRLQKGTSSPERPLFGHLGRGVAHHPTAVTARVTLVSRSRSVTVTRSGGVWSYKFAGLGARAVSRTTGWWQSHWAQVAVRPPHSTQKTIGKSAQRQIGW